jgi:hypothetical protein
MPPEFWDVGWTLFFSGLALFGLVFATGQMFSRLKRPKTYVVAAFCVLAVVLAVKCVDAYPAIHADRVYEVWPSSGDVSVVQGQTVDVAFDVTSFWDKEVAIPVAGFSLHYSSFSIDELLSYSLSTDELVLQPDVSGSVVVTLETAQNAPTGTYTFYLTFGEINNGFYERIRPSSYGFQLHITPNPQ